MKDYHAYADFETRSEADLFKVGAWKYAADPSTYPLMLSVWLPISGRALQWLEYKHGRECPSWVRDLVLDPDVTFHAWNANFEIAVWRRVLVERWGWPDLPTERWSDTMGRARHANLPGALANACKVLKVPIQKGSDGKGLINRLSVPQKAVKMVMQEGVARQDSFTYLESKGIELFTRDEDQGPVWFWDNNTKALADFAKYNERDTKAEHSACQVIPPYSATEAEVWALDSKINELGIPIDRELCEAAAELFEWVYDRCESDIQALTNDEIRAPSQTKKVVEWIGERVDGFGKSLNKDWVEVWLERYHAKRELDKPTTKAEDEVAAILEIRTIYGGAAVKKYNAALHKIEGDERARGEFIYHKASPGRWAGSGIQVQNLFRQAIPAEEVFTLVKTADFQKVQDYCNERNLQIGHLIRSCVRGLIKAPEGKTLIVSDFAGIESRVLQWVAGNQEALDLFADGVDMYVHTAAVMYGLEYADMMGPKKVKPEHKEHRQIGKAAVLGLGYQMGAEKFVGELQKNGIDEDQAFAKDIVDKWRKNNPLVAGYDGLWKRVERACIKIIKSKPKGHGAKVRAFSCPDRFLRITWEWNSLVIELPGGKKLFYPQAKIVEGRFGGPAIKYLDGGKNWVDTYGGKLVENIIQAISRNLLCHSMKLAIEDFELPIIMHVHDELVAEVSKESSNMAFSELHYCMTTTPDWARGLPLAAETYESERYTK